MVMTLGDLTSSSCGIVGDGHELHVAWTSQDGMVGSVEPDRLEGKGLRPVIGRIPKGDRQINLAKWHGLLSRHDAVERRSGRSDARSVDAHGVERLGVHDVDAAVSIHQYLGEALCTKDRVDHKQISPRLQDAFRVVGLVEGYGGF